MDSRKILYSNWKNDECITLDYWVRPIVKYTPRIWNNIVRCPFDKEDSEFVKQYMKAWFKVVFSHIDNWQDFFKYEPEKWDMLVSNPPFTNKRKFFKRALSFYKPFALLMTNTRLNDAAPKQLFKDRDLQLLMFDKRMKFKNNWIIQNKITFSSSYYCWNFLPKQIIMEEL